MSIVKSEPAPIATSRNRGKECLSVEDLVCQRSAGPLPNPWLSRWVVLCKDGDNKVGLRVQSIDKGIFVCLVIPGSPAAMAGLRFGDQLLTLGRTALAGMTSDAVHCRLRCGPVNNIVMAVRDRPICRSMVLHKDAAGRLGIKIERGTVAAIAVDSSAAKNGLLIGHHIIEVGGQCVVGLQDKELGKLFEEGGQVVTLTLMPSGLFRRLVRGMSDWLVRHRMDHSLQQ